MKLRIAYGCVFCLLFSVLGAYSQTPTAANPSSSSALAVEGTKIDPAKEADIRKLLALTGAKAVALQVVTTMEGNIKPLMLRSLPAGDYREQLIDLFLKRFHSKLDSDTFVGLSVPFYDKYLSHDEIKGLIQFYSTPLGQKVVKVMPQLVAEAQAAGSKWGESIGRQSMMEVLAEHPDLKKALEESAKAANPN